MASVTGAFFSARSGSSIYFEDVGSGPPVLALHGIGGGAYFFSGLAKRLENRFRVLSLDMPGTGKSVSAQKDFSLEKWSTDIADLIQEKIGAPTVILGHSLGTMVALKMWESRPEWIRSLVFACGLPKVRPNIHERLTARAEDIEKNGIHGWGSKAAIGVFSGTSLRERPEAVGMFSRLFDLQDPLAYVHSIRVLLSTDVTSIVPTVSLPCLAIAGAEDSYAPPDSVNDFISKIPGNCALEIIPECAHMPFFEAPELFAETVGNFIAHLKD